MIVTTAALHVCRFDPKAVSLESGTIPDEAEFKEVGAIRYRKSFDVSGPSHLKAGDTLGTLERHSQRSVMIVKASELPRWLREFHITGPMWRA
jgi:hypothetical protein